MPPGRGAPQHRPTFRLSVVVIAVLAAAMTIVAVVVLPPAPSWTERTVTLSLMSYGCYWENSSAHQDRFCLLLEPTPGGLLLNGSFDHGPGGGPGTGIQMGTGPCASGCPTSATWTAPDGSGRLFWTFAENVTLEVPG
jgi:hypothetical protein